MMEGYIAIGGLAYDSITGFEGMVTARVEYWGGYCRVEITRQNESSAEKPMAEWFDVKRVVPHAKDATDARR